MNRQRGWTPPLLGGFFIFLGFFEGVVDAAILAKICSREKIIRHVLSISCSWDSKSYTDQANAWTLESLYLIPIPIPILVPSKHVASPWAEPWVLALFACL
ncbi:MAG: hypothetical protein ACRC12_05110 [Holosporales bacterium]